jgi:hypothetical protein
MDVFRFAKLPLKANDSTRRYRVMRGVERDHVGTVEVVGSDSRPGGTLRVTVACLAVLSDAAREDALATAVRFVEELSAGWGLHIEDGTRDPEWTAQPDGSFLKRIEYKVV